MMKSRAVILLPISLMLMLLLIAGPSIGNPLVPTIDPPNEEFFLFVDQNSVAILVLINFSTDLLLFSSLLLLAGFFFGKGVGRLDTDTRSFGVKMLLGAFIICILGAIIDLFIILDTVDDPRDLSTRYYILTTNLVSWAIASVLISATVYTVSVFLLKVDRIYALMPAIGIGALNLWWWFLCMHYYRSIIQVTVVISIILCPIMVFLLAHWHRHTFSTSDLESQEVETL